MRERLQSADDEAVVDYARLAPHATRALPSPEHFLPLLVALGAAGPGRRAERVYEEMMHGVLAMDAYVFEPA